MPVDPDHLKFTHPVRLRRDPTLIRTAEEALDWIDDKDTDSNVQQALRMVRHHLYEAIDHTSKKEADDARDKMVHILDGMRLTHR